MSSTQTHPNTTTTGSDALSPLLRWALHLAGRGWAVFPLRPLTKDRPMVKDWEHCATTDTATIHAWWMATPTANIGLACGPSNLYVVDCDVLKPGEPMPAGHPAGRVESGLQVLRALAARRGDPIAATYAVTTASGGWHLYYTQPAGAALRNTAGKLGFKLDTRGHGGYVVGPGSVLPHGGYELYDDRDATALPGWIHQAVTVRPAPASAAPPQSGGVRLTGYVTAALLAETTNVIKAPPGQRNAILSRSAYALGQLVGAGVLDHLTARTALERAWATWTPPGSASKDLGAGGVIDTSLTAGAANPRRITGRQDNT